MFCDRGKYNYYIAGRRLDETKLEPRGTYVNPYEAIFNSFFTLVEDSPPTHVLKFRPTKEMWPGTHEISVGIIIKYYKQSSINSPVSGLVYYSKTYVNECSVDYA